jgi:acyl carrier protein
MKLEEITANVREIVVQIIASDKNIDMGAIILHEEDSLIDGGLIDSLLMVQLIEEMDGRFDIVINPAELSLENFDSIGRISQFVLAKMNGAG